MTDVNKSPSDDAPEWIRKAQVGDKVICTSDFSTDPRAQGLKLPMMHGTYTIREIGEGVDTWGKWQVSFKLKEILNPNSQNRKEPMFVSVGFKPVEPHKRTMDFFRKIASDPESFSVPQKTLKEKFLQVT